MQRSLPLMAIVTIIFFNVSGGTYAIEDIIAAGPGLAISLLVLTPLVWSAPVALVCAELGSAIPEEGGYYAWSKRALGPFGSFCQGWWAWLFTFIDIGIYPTMLCDYLAYFDPAFGAGGDYWLRKGLMIVMIWTFVLLNMFGSRTVSGFAGAFFVLVMSPFVILVVGGLYVGLTRGFAFSAVTPLVSPGRTFGAVVATAIPVVLWNYMGWDSISTIAGEMENPRRDYPRALLITILLITTIYLLPTVVSLGFVGTEHFHWTSGSWSNAAEKVVGPWLGKLMSAMGMVSAIGMFSALVLVYSRVPFVMGKDGFLPQVLMRKNRWNAPWVSLLVSGAVYTVVILAFRNVEELTSADVSVYGAMLSLELLSFLVLRWREPTLARPFKVPGGWFVAVGLCTLPLVCLGAGAYFRVQQPAHEGGGLWNVVGLAVLVMASGPLLYPLAAWWRRKLEPLA